MKKNEFQFNLTAAIKKDKDIKEINSSKYDSDIVLQLDVKGKDVILVISERYVTIYHKRDEPLNLPFVKGMSKQRVFISEHFSTTIIYNLDIENIIETIKNTKTTYSIEELSSSEGCALF